MRAGASCAWWAASAPGFCGVRGTIAARSLALARQRAVKTDQMQARTRHQRGQALHEFQTTTAARQTLVNAQSARGVYFALAGTLLLPIEFGTLPKLFAPIEPVHYFQRKLFWPMG